MNRKEMKSQLMGFLINSIAKLITPTLIMESIGAGLDFLERKVVNSEPTIDDQLILPIIKAIRELMHIEEEPG